MYGKTYRDFTELFGEFPGSIVNKKSELMLVGRATASVNFVRRLSWSISSIFQRKCTLSVRRSLK